MLEGCVLSARDGARCSRPAPPNAAARGQGGDASRLSRRSGFLHSRQGARRAWGRARERCAHNLAAACERELVCGGGTAQWQSNCAHEFIGHENRPRRHALLLVEGFYCSAPNTDNAFKSARCTSSLLKALAPTASPRRLSRTPSLQPFHPRSLAANQPARRLYLTRSLFLSNQLSSRQKNPSTSSTTTSETAEGTTAHAAAAAAAGRNDNMEVRGACVRRRVAWAGFAASRRL